MTGPEQSTSPFEVDGQRVVWRGGGETLVVEAWGPSSVRVRATLKGEILDTEWALLPPEPVLGEVTVDGTVATLVNGDLHVVLRHSEEVAEVLGHHRFRCAVSFHKPDGTLLFRELDPGGSLALQARRLRGHLGGDLEVTAAFEADRDEKLYGMGMYQQHVLDLKGSTLELAHRNSQATVPFVMSSAGYGFLWHNPAVGRATFAANRTEWFASTSDQLDYWVTAGGTPAAICAAYADATGHAPVMPERGLGFWQCKLRYASQQELLDVAAAHTGRGLPLDVIVADFFHWPQMGDFRFDPDFWPEPRAMVAELADRGTDLMVSVWPQIAYASENYADLARQNMLVRAERGMDVHMSFEGPSAFLDVTDPAARRWLWDVCRRNYHDLGVRTFWLDEAEPEYGVYDYDNYRYHLGSGSKVGNIYPQMFARAFFDGQQASGQDDVVNLVRCAWAGSQRYGALVWSGDIHSTFEDLRRQITAGIHMGVAGIPWFTTDIGGFHGGDGEDPAFHELLVRWFQFGTFSPVMRLHGDRKPYQLITGPDGSRRLRSGGPNELWSFGEEIYEILAAHVHLRERLRPYTRRLMAEAHTAGQPVMRGMFHEFPGDPVAWDLDDQYMYGGDVLVAPVLEPGATSREVYLPRGSRWLDVHTGAQHDGGRRVSVPTSLERIPVFLRDGCADDVVAAFLT
ncbi:family 31 glucosidase [Actinotalea sp. BY-33]|uniref:Family 31 glucosidase n=1 Tax=Actinotalea soli TaxID=2819234 RepID=A0A939LQT2_9CELL|nr:TIM-barrel domain-containing protein [Actinotalea soli]MBO1752118.1 family 31 glucosidase [Actinotalea soli]